MAVLGWRKNDAQRRVDDLRRQGRHEEADAIQYGGDGDGHRCNFCGELQSDSRRHRCWAVSTSAPAKLTLEDCLKSNVVGFPIFVALGGQVVLDIRNPQQLAVVRNVLRVHEEAAKKLSD